jgi:hypothetical protein
MVNRCGRLAEEAAVEILFAKIVGVCLLEKPFSGCYDDPRFPKSELGLVGQTFLSFLFSN